MMYLFSIITRQTDQQLNYANSMNVFPIPNKNYHPVMAESVRFCFVSVVNYGQVGLFILLNRFSIISFKCLNDCNKHLIRIPLGIVTHILDIIKNFTYIYSYIFLGKNYTSFELK